VRVRFHDADALDFIPTIRRCQERKTKDCATRTRDEFALGHAAVFSRAELGEPVAVYPSSQFVVAVDSDSGDIEVFEIPESSSRRATTDGREPSHTERLRTLGEKLQKFWERRS
jgi:hypothetical protein